jgi:hypothetical protein
MNIAIMCSIPGIGVKDCVKNINSQAMATIGCNVKWVDLEEELISPAEEFLRLRFPHHTGSFKLAHVVSLPDDELASVWHEAFDNAISELANKTPKGDVSLLSMHPVMYHQNTQEYIQLFDHGIMRSILEKHSARVSSIFSVHDDIYDIYRTLLSPNHLFHPDTTRPPKWNPASRTWVSRREPETDLTEMRQILDWRDRELSASRNLSRALQTPYFLFPRKTRTRTVWDVIFANRPCVYFSHPISQPRRDINGIIHPVKCLVPDSQRGTEFISLCQEFCDSIAAIAPIVEPACIDEYRIGDFSDSVIAERQLNSHILPPVTERWPIGVGDRLGFPFPLDEAKLKLLPVGADVFSDRKIDTIETRDYVVGLQMLSEEILRQINVRDHILAYQAQLIVAYRPFISPNSPEPSGGVLEEVNTMVTKKHFNHKICQPAVLIIHPQEDEARRRENAFHAWWEINSQEYFVSDQALESFKSFVWETLQKLTNIDEIDKEHEKLLAAMKTAKLKPISVTRDTTMPSGKMLGLELLQTSFLDELLKKSTVVFSTLHMLAHNEPDLIRIISNNPSITETVVMIDSILKERKI